MFFKKKKHYIVREARIEDISSVMHLSEKLRQECYYYYPPIEPDWYARNLEKMIGNYEHGCVLVAEYDDFIFGALVAQADRMIHSRMVVANINGFFIDEEYRDKFPMAAVRLLRGYDKWAEKVAGRAFVRIDNPKDLERKEKLFDRLGYIKAGGPTYGKEFK